MTNTQSDLYKTIAETSEGSFKDKGSRFLSFAFPVTNEEEIKKIVGELRKNYHDARHHCYAYRINPENPSYRVNDDGEPSGTAGKPIYGQLLSNDLHNILIVVVRYFGGTLLGTSGLINAYKLASADCIHNAKILEKKITALFEIRFPYEKMNLVKRIIKEENIDVIHQIFDINCMMTIQIRKNAIEQVSERLEKIDQLQIALKNL